MSPEHVAYLPGARVAVSEESSWAQGALATVAEPPKPVRDLTGEWVGCRRVVGSLKGPILCYWVVFDCPHYDADGDGPYSAAELPEDLLTPLPVS